MKNMKPRTKSRMTALVIVLALFLALTIAGGVLAKYIGQNMEKAEMISAKFHVSSDYLKETALDKKYTLPGPGAFTVDVNNFEVDNVDNISALDVSYTITVTGGRFSAKNGTALSTDPVVLSVDSSLTGGTSKHDTYTIVPNGNATEVIVNVTSTSPYNKPLKATFTVPKPKYTLVKDGTTAILTIKTGLYNGPIKINCNIKPDNDNDLMQTWQTGDTKELTVTNNETYVLTFFGTVTEVTTETNITDPAGAGLTIGG